MATIRQIEANRRNSLHSTGPKTPEGKAAVRLNALRHGLRARGILLPGENEEEYNRLCADLEAEWQPQNRTEQLLLEQMAVAQWKLARLEIGERSIFLQDLPAERQLALLDRFSLHRGRLEHSFARATRELQCLRKPDHTRDKRRASSGKRQQNAILSEISPQPGYVMAESETAAAQPMLMSSPAQPDSR